MIPCKTAAAFQLSARILREEQERLYFWTFTFERTVSDRWAMAMFDKLHEWMSRWCNGLLRGLRVVELHKEHGVHFHVIMNRRIPVTIVRRVAKRWGFGRIHVVRCWDGAAAYLSKYMVKEYRRQYPCGMRRWGTLGGFQGTRVRDLVFESRSETNRRELFGRNKVDLVAVQAVYLFSDFFGEVGKWPEHFTRKCQELGGLIEKTEEEEEWWRQWKREAGQWSEFERALWSEIRCRQVLSAIDKVV